MDDNWLYLEAKRNGLAWAAAVRVPFGPSRWPEFGHQVTLVLRYTPHWRTGLPKPKELTRLQDFEDRMIDSIGEDGALVATETSDTRRTIHLRLPEGGLLDMYRELERKHTDGGLVITVAHDPEWAAAAHLAQFARAA
jgi:hypothetical protein